MSTLEGMIEVRRFKAEPGVCGYLPQETASLEYRFVTEITAPAYRELLRRGWRRFGYEFFRPACPTCRKCRSLRIKVREFMPSRSQRRALKCNEHIRVVMQSPTVSDAHLALYDAYHQAMHARRGWRLRSITKGQYAASFLAGNTGFAREILYLNADKLMGVTLVDLVADAVSSVYFFHDPAWRPNAPGVFSILQTLKVAQAYGAAYQYLGYWIEECQSMAYKNKFRPHQLLQFFPGDEEEPVWVDADTRGLTIRGQ